jgi:hypothetical protein
VVEGVSFRISPGGATVCWHVLLRRKAWPGYSASGRGPQCAQWGGPRWRRRDPVVACGSRCGSLFSTAPPCMSMRYSSHLQNCILDFHITGFGVKVLLIMGMGCSTIMSAQFAFTNKDFRLALS